MNSKELRIGNRLSNGIVTKLSEDEIWFNDGYATWKGSSLIHNKLEPISLTPEILEKCGFSHSMENDFFLHWPDEDLELRFYNGKYYFQPDHCLTLIDDRWAVDHLHQLQNLYFALTGEELNYQP